MISADSGARSGETAPRTTVGTAASSGTVPLEPRPAVAIGHMWLRTRATNPCGPVPITQGVHHYGHGGSGISIAHGCAREVSALIDTLRADRLNQSSR